MIKIATTDSDFMYCFTLMLQLRPHLIKDEFLSLSREMQNMGYQLAFLEKSGIAVALAGYRININYFMGKHLYVDDLVTDESCRSKGYGEELIQWLKQTANDHNCEYLHLDSGTQRHRAHKFYLSQDFNIASYHFTQKL